MAQAIIMMHRSCFHRTSEGDLAEPEGTAGMRRTAKAATLA